MQKLSEYKVSLNFKTGCLFVLLFCTEKLFSFTMVLSSLDVLIMETFLIISGVEILACPTYLPMCGLCKNWCLSWENGSDGEA